MVAQVVERVDWCWRMWVWVLCMLLVC